jgi:PDZ domain-containing protein
LWQAVSGWFSRSNRVIPREYVYPDYMTKEQNKQQAAEEYASSQSYAIAAAMKFLKRPVNEYPVIITVESGAPSQGLLHAGDLVVAVDGFATATPEEVVSRVHAVKAGSSITFTVKRNNQKLDVVVKSSHRVDDPATETDESGMAYVGIAVDSQYSADFDIEFGVNGVGGPSGGLMFTLGIIDMLTPGALADGKEIAGTGTIAPDGTVGTIGGIQQKMLGARSHEVSLFLAPSGNCDSVVGHVPDGLTVASVSTVGEAIKAIDDFTHGRTPTPCATK